jgi:hypothetical protein
MPRPWLYDVHTRLASNGLQFIISNPKNSHFDRVEDQSGRL